LGVDNARLIRERSDLTRELASLRQEIARQQRIANSYREDEYLFRQGEEMYRQRLLANSPQDVLERAVESHLSNAELRARERAEQADPPRRLTHVVPPSGYPAGRALTREAIAQWTVRQLRGIRDRVIMLRTVAHENSVKGLPIPVRLDWYIDEPVFRKDELVTLRLVDGTDSGGLILGDVMYFLQHQVRMAATQPPKSMVPGDEEGLGDASYEQIYEAVAEIMKIRGPAVLRAKSKQDTLRSGPLNLYLEVSPLDDTLRSDLR
jgi:hypothetical protein